MKQMPEVELEKITRPKGETRTLKSMWRIEPAWKIRPMWVYKITNFLLGTERWPTLLGFILQKILPRKTTMFFYGDQITHELIDRLSENIREEIDNEILKELCEQE